MVLVISNGMISPVASVRLQTSYRVQGRKLAIIGTLLNQNSLAHGGIRIGFCDYR
jgi:hypothetical protein